MRKQMQQKVCKAAAVSIAAVTLVGLGAGAASAQVGSLKPAAPSVPSATSVIPPTTAPSVPAGPPSAPVAPPSAPQLGPNSPLPSGPGGAGDLFVGTTLDEILADPDVAANLARTLQDATGQALPQGADLMRGLPQLDEQVPSNTDPTLYAGQAVESAGGLGTTTTRDMSTVSAGLLELLFGSGADKPLTRHSENVAKERTEPKLKEFTQEKWQEIQDAKAAEEAKKKLCAEDGCGDATYTMEQVLDAAEQEQIQQDSVVLTDPTADSGTPGVTPTEDNNPCNDNFGCVPVDPGVIDPPVDASATSTVIDESKQFSDAGPDFGSDGPENVIPQGPPPAPTAG